MVAPRRAALSGLGGRCRGTYAAAWIIYAIYQRREREEEEGGGWEDGTDFIRFFFGGGVISPACVRTLCAEVIAGPNGHTDRCDSVASRRALCWGKICPYHCSRRATPTSLISVTVMPTSPPTPAHPLLSPSRDVFFFFFFVLAIESMARSLCCCEHVHFLGFFL